MVPGARVKVKEGKRVAVGQILVEWDPFTTPILTEVSGKLVYRDIVEAITVREEFDEVTGLASRASELVRQLLALSRKSVMHRESFDLAMEIHQQRPMLERLRHADPDFDSSAWLPQHEEAGPMRVVPGGRRSR